MEQIYHPSHYNKAGRKECIVEMQEYFGAKSTFIFELLNAYKYLYRAGDKENNSYKSDIEKAANYINMATKLREDHPEVADISEVFMYDMIKQEFLKRSNQNYDTDE